jgi:hypothetical protein
VKRNLLAPLLLLAACSPPTPLTVEEADKPTSVNPVHEAVSAFVVKNTDDPASYEPASWGTPNPWQQKDANKIAADKAMLFAEDDFANAKKRAGAHSAYGKKIFDESVASAKHYQNKADSLLHAADTTRLGLRISHSYRAKNKMGALQLDSAHFIVYKNGKVERL